MPWSPGFGPESKSESFFQGDSDPRPIGVDLTGILGGTHGGTYYKSPAVEAKNTFSYIVMQVIWCLKFRNMTKSGGIIPHSKL